ncbi:hypothetical protein HYH02_000697 [Chlamydomonas schloesseri]|uniref:Phosphatidic acid phosphatase type 2/haloperoxidase domain-containing protein n=1 Tax=Chlamydomonas schloesseri TaxID=2026947 RepID=A0A836BCY0_9CHLO|nr:hypothetical protein HYH02_000697 [Chlamydomonas schloesseri]|eukprot:KAG2454866.1 hypothetical protein HYH02_000697 [Chlamydomonas schloesseri]
MYVTMLFFAVPGALLLLACILARPITGYVRKHVRPPVLKLVHKQIDGVAALQSRWRNVVLDVLVRITALTVTVEWYLITLPPFCWFGGVSGVLGTMAVVQCMAVSTYMACVLKDLLSCPRPAPAACAVSAARQRARDKATAGKAEEPTSQAAQSQAAAGLALDGSALPSSPSAASLFDALPSSPSGAVLPGSGAKGARGSKGAGEGQDASSSSAAAARAAVEVLEEAYRGEIEYGAPSMHTWCAFIMPAYSALAAAQVGGLPLLQRWLFGGSGGSSGGGGGGTGLAGWLAGLEPGAFAALLVALAAAWSGWVAWSRLYLGVHTKIDLALGAAAGAAVLGLWRLAGLPMALAAAGLLPYGGGGAIGAAGGGAGGGVLGNLVPDGGSGGVVWLAVVGLVYLVALGSYPRPLAHSTSYEYAVIFLGAAWGGLASSNTRTSLAAALLGLRPEMQHGAHTAAGGRIAALRAVLQAAVPPPLRHPLLLAIAGFTFVAVFKELFKAVLLVVLPRLFDLAPPALRRAWQPWAVHPSGCWRPPPPPTTRAEVVATVEAVAVAEEASDSKGAAGGGATGLRSRALAQGAAREDGKMAAATAGAVAAAAPKAGSSKAERTLARATALVKAGVLMKTPSLPYDVDFARKFLNYGAVVYAAIEMRYIVWQLVGIEST